MKMRLCVQRPIIMRKIIQIKFSGEWFYSSNYQTPYDIQRWYEFMKTNVNFVEEVHYKNNENIVHTHYLNNAIHCVFAPAITEIDTKLHIYRESYYLFGSEYSKEFWNKRQEVIRGQREYKLKRILK